MCSFGGGAGSRSGGQRGGPSRERVPNLLDRKQDRLRPEDRRSAPGQWAPAPFRGPAGAVPSQRDPVYPDARPAPDTVRREYASRISRGATYRSLLG